jgi:hypothetical protein
MFFEKLEKIIPVFYPKDRSDRRRSYTMEEPNMTTNQHCTHIIRDKAFHEHQGAVQIFDCLRKPAPWGTTADDPFIREIDAQYERTKAAFERRYNVKYMGNNVISFD